MNNNLKLWAKINFLPRVALAGVFYHNNGEVTDSWVAFIQRFSTWGNFVLQECCTTTGNIIACLNRGAGNTAVNCVLSPRKLLTPCNVHSPLYLFSLRCAERQLCDSPGFMSQDDCALESSMEGFILMLSVTTYKSSLEIFGPWLFIAILSKWSQLFEAFPDKISVMLWADTVTADMLALESGHIQYKVILGMKSCKSCLSFINLGLWTHP